MAPEQSTITISTTILQDRITNPIPTRITADMGQAAGSEQLMNEINLESQARQNLDQANEVGNNHNWMQARLIVCSVHRSTQGGNQSSRGNFDKLNMTDAAEIVGMSRNTLDAYMRTWDAAALDGHCKPADELEPEDGPTAHTPHQELWESYWVGNDHREPSKPSTPFEKALKGLKAFQKNASSGLSFNELNELIAEAERALQSIGGRK